METKKIKKPVVREEKESDIQRTICEYLSLKKYFFWRNNNIPAFDRKTGKVWFMPKYGMNGTPDIIIIKDGMFIGLEVKTKRGKPSEAQKEFARLCDLHSGEYHVVRSIDDVKEVGL